MSIQISLNRVLVAFVVAGLATLCWWIAGPGLFHWPEWACLWVFGFVLLVLSLSITPNA